MLANKVLAKLFEQKIAFALFGLKKCAAPPCRLGRPVGQSLLGLGKFGRLLLAGQLAALGYAGKQQVKVGLDGAQFVFQSRRQRAEFFLQSSQGLSPPAPLGAQGPKLGLALREASPPPLEPGENLPAIVMMPERIKAERDETVEQHRIDHCDGRSDNQ